MMNTPFSVAIDSSGNLYVADADNNRINKYNSAGVFQGWTGKILTSPTGGAPGCSGASVGTITPGWCKGGTADSGTEDGAMNYPRGIAVDPQGNLYVSEMNNARISKFNSAGVYQGWIGEISSSPTGGATGCNGAAVGSLTPGWCKGGASVGGYRDGSLDGPTGVMVDLFGNLYVADTNNDRVTRYSLQR
jgi:sugar lactone lactonase YvrE